MNGQKTYVLDGGVTRVISSLMNVVKNDVTSDEHDGRDERHEEAIHDQRMSLSDTPKSKQSWVADVVRARHRAARGHARRPRGHHSRVEPYHCTDAADGQGWDRPGPQPRLCDGARSDVRRRECRRTPLSTVRRRPRGCLRRVAGCRGRRRRPRGAPGALPAAPGGARRRARRRRWPEFRTDRRRAVAWRSAPRRPGRCWRCAAPTG